MNYKALFYPFLLGYKLPMDLPTRIQRRLLRTFGRPTRYEKLRKTCLNTAFLNSYFFHLAGAQRELRDVDTSLTSWRELDIS